jgi:hypothetical protein
MKLGVTHKITRFYWYNKSSQSLPVFSILAAKLQFCDEEGIRLEGMYSIGEDVEEQLYPQCCQDKLI